MNSYLTQKQGAARAAARDLARLQTQAEQARAELADLQQERVKAEEGFDTLRGAQLMEANEQLVIATLQAQSEAASATRSAKRDALTDLPNRALLLDRLEQAIAISRRRSTRLALLFLDLDSFKQINDRHGHAVGDTVLKLVSQRLAATVRDADTVSRHGGDEFVILLTEVSQAADAARIADKLIAALGAPFRVAEYEFQLSASIGVSLYPDDGEDAGELIGHADAAMYRVKRQGRGGFGFHESATAGTPGSPAAFPGSPHAFVRHELAVAEREQRHAQLRDANEQLLLAVLSAQQLQAVAEEVQLKQKEFLAVVAHELRNPLGPIRMATGLLSRAPVEDLPGMQMIIEREVEHLSRLIADLLDVSQADTGKLRLDRRMVDLRNIIDEAVDACRWSMETRQQDLMLDLPESALETRADPVRLAQVFRNLIDNASKYTPDSGRIRVSVALIDDAIMVSIADNGIGISAESLTRAFEPFAQDATRLNAAGLGIGLTVVRELVEAHGGTVAGSSAGDGLGSTFVVTLPLTR